MVRRARLHVISSICMCLYLLFYMVSARYLQKGPLGADSEELHIQLTLPPMKPRFRDFSYISDINSCLYRIKSSSWAKFGTVDELLTRGICGVGAFEEAPARRSATPQGLEARSNGEKSRADDDGTAVDMTMTMRFAKRRFIF